MMNPLALTKPHGFPRGLYPYTFPSLPGPRLDNSRRIYDLTVDGKLTLTLDDAIALALENNLEIAVTRYSLPIAQTDLLRAEGGGATRGVAGSYQSTLRRHSESHAALPRSPIRATRGRAKPRRAESKR